MAKTTFGGIVGDRGFFPDVRAKEGRKDILDVLTSNYLAWGVCRHE